VKISRQTVDLSVYPDLVIIYLGMRVNRRNRAGVEGESRVAAPVSEQDLG
jgi:hypothetical protein